MLALCARDPTEHHFGAQRSDRCNPIIKEIVMTFDIDTIESAEQSVTATVCENAALYGAAPERGEFDSREIWDADDATDAVSEAFRILAEGVAPDGFQLADERESLLWGFVNMLDAQVRRVDRAVDRLSSDLRDLQKAQDGTEIKSRELELVIDRARNLGDRRDAFETLRDTAADAYREETGDTWRPRHGSHASQTGKLTSAAIDARDFVRARKDRATMAHLRGRETDFLPLNRGNNHGAGNPPVEGNWKTAYLWDEVLQADSLLEILQRFMHLEVKEKQVKTDKGVRTVRKETMIFPRYHQLDAVRNLVAHAKAHGAGRNYLIQHSAGSGKSNSIAWLAHRLASLHDAHDEKVFHSVVVVTDRRVLDQQLQYTIYQFEHKTGVVEKIDEDTRQLARALSQGTPIVITTIQKFPFISRALWTLEKKGFGVRIETAGKRFAVIVDEAHSSQSGETATALKGMLNKEGIEAAIAAQLLDEEDDALSDGANAAVLRDALQRARQPNLSFFAFTATPKFKTKALFDEPGASGASPFHE